MMKEIKNDEKIVTKENNGMKEIKTMSDAIIKKDLFKIPREDSKANLKAKEKESSECKQCDTPIYSAPLLEYVGPGAFIPYYEHASVKTASIFGDKNIPFKLDDEAVDIIMEIEKLLMKAESQYKEIRHVCNIIEEMVSCSRTSKMFKDYYKEFCSEAYNKEMFPTVFKDKE